MEKNKTQRGFDITNFNDRYNAKCSIQKSSLATEDAIWFGIDNPDPQIMISDAKKLGISVDTNAEYGWMKYKIPEEVLITTRMHLTVEMVKEILPILEKFVETGEID